MLIIRRVNCIDAASGIATRSKWLSGAQVEREHSLNLCTGRPHTAQMCVSAKPKLHTHTERGLRFLSVLQIIYTRGYCSVPLSKTVFSGCSLKASKEL